MDRPTAKTHCQKCGAELAQGNAFCTSCGAPANNQSENVSSAAADRIPAASAAGAPVAPGPVRSIPPADAIGCASPKFALAAGAVVLLLIVAIIAVMEHRTNQRGEKEAQAGVGSGTRI